MNILIKVFKKLRMLILRWKGGTEAKGIRVNMGKT